MLLPSVHFCNKSSACDRVPDEPKSGAGFPSCTSARAPGALPFPLQSPRHRGCAGSCQHHFGIKLLSLPNTSYKKPIVVELAKQQHKHCSALEQSERCHQQRENSASARCLFYFSLFLPIENVICLQQLML